jgi:alpha-1,3-rhamnosyl/mannosyltransferase
VSDRALRVGFDGRTLTSPAAGVRRYVQELTYALLQLGEPLQLVALGGSGPMPPPIQRQPEPWHPPTNLGWTLVGLRRAAHSAALDVYHGPAYTAPAWGVHPLVLTIHDVSYARTPEWYPYRRDFARRWFYRASAVAADRIITDSRFSQREITAAYGIDDSRIRVIPLGVSSRFTPANGGDSARTAAGASYVLHVGDLHPRRNLGVALDAVLRLRAEERALADLTLVVAGVDRGVVSELAQRAAASGHPQALVARGPVEEAELLRLYRGAAALVYPSQYEGFGLPILEAMACGIPVLASRTPSAEEVGGDAALLLPPDDAGAWTSALRGVLSDAHCSADLRQRGAARAALFTWSRTARATYEVYRECAQL